MPAFAELLASLDADPEVRGRQFEHICKWFLGNDPQYQARLSRVWLWKEWPGRWSDAEAGIDMVAEDHDGRLWAVQAKAYAPERAVTKDDMNTFLSESSRAGFAYRMLIATTDKLSPTAERTVQAQEKPVFQVLRSDLLTAELDWPASIHALRPAKPRKPAKPKDYQRDAIRAVVKGFGIADRGQLIMACGTGKTLTSLFIAEKLSAGRVLVLVPSLSLLKQTMRVWAANRSGDGPPPLAVCSDETVGRDDDMPVAHTSELGIPVTTDPAEVAAFLRRRTGARVVFSTYQSSPQIAAAQALGRVPGFDLVVADEAHRCAGPVSSDFATVLDPSGIKAARRLFMTAAPRYFTGRVVEAAKEADFEVASMDDETTFGPVLYRLSFAEAIRRKELTDYQVVVVGVDNTTYREWAHKGTLVTRDGKTRTDARSLAGEIGLAKAMKKYDLRRVISFHSRVKRAREFATELPEVIDWMPARQRPKGRLWARPATGQMSAGERHILLQRLAQLDGGERGLLTSARCLAEGVDVPALDGVAFIDPRRSEVDIVQAVGRAIRKSEDKTVGTIVIPVFIDTDIDPEKALDDSVFKPVWDVVKALRAHDEDLAEQLDSLRRSMGRRRGVPKPPSKIHFDLPARVGADFVRAFDTRLVEQTTASWEFWFGLLEKYVSENATAAVNVNYQVLGHRLGAWCSNQRNKYRLGQLPEEYASRLDALPDWSWDVNDSKWGDGLKQLLKYVAANGHALVSAEEVFNDYPLGNWAAIQRRDRRSGRLSKDREKQLSAIPGWAWSLEEERWEKGFRHLVEYVEDAGDSLVTQVYESPDRFRLGVWVNFQRTRYNKGTLEADRVARLDQLPGWVWVAADAKWEKSYRYLLAYMRQFGTARVKAGYVTDEGFKLYNWVSNQRAKWRKLSDERREKLSALRGWVVNTNDAQWQEGLDRLLTYVAEYGTSAVPRNYEIDGFRLGSWVDSRRHEYRSGTLRPDRAKTLAALADWSWSPRGPNRR